MRYVRNSDRLREIMVATRHQIVSLKDIQMDMMQHDTKLANNISTQISALEEVYKHQLTLVNQAENAEPKRKTGHIQTQHTPRAQTQTGGMDWDGVKRGLGVERYNARHFLLCFLMIYFVFWSACLMCQMRMSGNGSERVCPAPFAGSGFRKLRETHTTKTLGGFFPTSVSG